MNNLGELFRQIRINKNWSIREAAKKMGISYSYLSILEKGVDPRTGKDSNPKPDTLRIISKAYDYPYEDLMKAAGYINDEGNSDRNFDLTVFISNTNLIMGKMTIETFVADICEKTGYSITAKQFKSYLSGDIEPFPGTINILSKYAHVTPDFWYVFNTEETLEKERKKYEEMILKASSGKYSKEYLMFSKLRDDIKSWLLDDTNLQYVKIAMEAQQKKVNPQSLKLMIDTIVTARDG
ncbi:MAG: helix-turn-helix domain-containing protein [Clostridia bacterium]|nr:helix-turn-helix domain-containing protein [Clostridia bacterium]